MGVSLAEFEQGAPFDGDYGSALAAVQQRLSRLQLAQIVHGKRAILLFEGWDGSGRKSALRLLTAAFDPCHLSVHPVTGPDFDDGRHWLAAFWARLPRAGETSIFFPSWYRRAAEARARSELGNREWARAFDEINEFEAQQTDHGTLIVKLFFHVAAEVQMARMQQRAEDAWLRWTLGDYTGQQPDRASWLAAWEELFARSDTRWARWTVVDGGDERSAAIAALTVVADALEKQVPLDPPAFDDEKVVKLVRG